MRRGITIITATALAALLAAPVALADRGGEDDDRDVEAAGRCTMGSTAKLDLSEEDGRVEVEFEVDENRVGSRWSVAVDRNGRRVMTRSAVTRRPSGSFEVRRLVAAGTRVRVTAVARQAATGEVCQARAVY